jgi:hypothetical protein
LRKQRRFFGRLIVEFRQDVAVKVHGDPDLRMPEDFHYRAWMHSISDQQSGGRMPQIVKAHPGQARSL